MVHIVIYIVPIQLLIPIMSRHYPTVFTAGLVNLVRRMRMDDHVVNVNNTGALDFIKAHVSDPDSDTYPESDRDSDTDNDDPESDSDTQPCAVFVHVAIKAFWWVRSMLMLVLSMQIALIKPGASARVRVSVRHQSVG